MQAFDLNLASRPFKNDTLPWAGFVVALLLLGFTSWGNVDSWSSHRTMLVDLKTRQENIDTRLRALDRRGSDAVRRSTSWNCPCSSRDRTRPTM